MFRQISLLFSSSVVLLAVLSPVAGLAGELAPTLKVGDKNLVLNGTGVREKYFLDLYVAGLYLTQPNNQPVAIINADTPMAIRIVITSRMVSQEKLIKSLQLRLARVSSHRITTLVTRISVDQADAPGQRMEPEQTGVSSPAKPLDFPSI